MIKDRMTLDWNAMRAMPLSSVVLRFGLIGAVAGVVAWVAVLGLRLFFDTSGPSVTALLLAIPRGALYGVILALILHWYWRRQSRKGERDGR